VDSTINNKIKTRNVPGAGVSDEDRVTITKAELRLKGTYPHRRDGIKKG